MAAPWRGRSSFRPGISGATRRGWLRASLSYDHSTLLASFPTPPVTPIISSPNSRRRSISRARQPDHVVEVAADGRRQQSALPLDAVRCHCPSARPSRRRRRSPPRARARNSTAVVTAASRRFGIPARPSITAIPVITRCARPLQRPRIARAAAASAGFPAHADREHHGVGGDDDPASRRRATSSAFARARRTASRRGRVFDRRLLLVARGDDLEREPEETHQAPPPRGSGRQDEWAGSRHHPPPPVARSALARAPPHPSPPGHGRSSPGGGALSS